MAALLGVGQRFLPGQAAQGPVVAPVAWQLDVWGLQIFFKANVGRATPARAICPFFLMLQRTQSASDHQALVHHMLGCSHSHCLAMPPLASYDRHVVSDASL